MYNVWGSYFEICEYCLCFIKPEEDSWVETYFKHPTKDERIKRVLCDWCFDREERLGVEHNRKY